MSAKCDLPVCLTLDDLKVITLRQNSSLCSLETGRDQVDPVLRSGGEVFLRHPGGFSFRGLDVFCDHFRGVGRVGSVQLDGEVGGIGRDGLGVSYQSVNPSQWASKRDT